MELDLNLIWFVLLGVLIAGYMVLDGFDLGVGVLHPLARTDHERRVSLNSIGPLWDGNEVWLVTFVGALFAAFPEAYATVFSGFYNAFMLLLLALIFRAVSIEFRSKIQHRVWRSICDWSFFGASLVIPLIIGVAGANIMLGMPLDERGEFTGSTVDLLTPYALLVGLFTVALVMMHGAIYLCLKTEGAYRRRVRRWAWHCFGVFLTLYLLTTIFTLMMLPQATANFHDHPWGVLVVVLSVLAIANIPRCLHRGRMGQAFASSSVAILVFVCLLAAAMFPNIVASAPRPEHSLTIYNAASSPTTLTIMLIIAGLGMPFVIGYTVVIYWTFRGKVRLDEHSY